MVVQAGLGVGGLAVGIDGDGAVGTGVGTFGQLCTGGQAVDGDVAGGAGSHVGIGGLHRVGVEAAGVGGTDGGGGGGRSTVAVVVGDGEGEVVAGVAAGGREAVVAEVAVAAVEGQDGAVGKGEGVVAVSTLGAGDGFIAELDGDALLAVGAEGHVDRAGDLAAIGAGGRGVDTDARHVVGNVDVERTAGGIAGLVGDGDGDVVGHRVIARLAVGLGAVERVGVLDRAAGDAGDGQGAAVGGNADAAGRDDGIAGRINGDAGAVDGEGGGFTVEAGDAEGAAGRCLVDVAGIAAAAGQVGFGHREFAAEDVQSVEDRCSRIGRRIGGAGNRLDFAQFGLATGHGELIEAFADAVKAHEGHAAFVATAPG